MHLIALTFDDGPSACTEPILDILFAHGAHPTFFVIGNLAQHRGTVLHRMMDEGHGRKSHMDPSATRAGLRR